MQDPSGLPSAPLPAPESLPPAALNELVGIVVTEFQLQSLFHKLTDLACRSIPSVDQASITMLDRDRMFTVAFSGDLAVPLDERQYADGFGPCVDAARGVRMIEIVDTSSEAHYADFSSLAVRFGVKRVLSAGMVAGVEARASLNLYSMSPRPMDAPLEQKMAATFAAYASVAVRNVRAYTTATQTIQNLEAALQSRAGIEQAKGIIMRDFRCSADEAFDRLRKHSQATNRKVRDIAALVIEANAQGTNRTPMTPGL